MSGDDHTGGTCTPVCPPGCTRFADTRPAPVQGSDEESVNLTPGVVWTEAQLAVVRDLTARLYKAEAAVQRVRELADPANCGLMIPAAQVRRALEGTP